MREPDQFISTGQTFAQKEKKAKAAREMPGEAPFARR